MRQAAPLSIQLKYQPPFDWDNLLSFFRAHAVPFLEEVDEVGFVRVVQTSSGLAWFQVTHEPRRKAVRLSLCSGNEKDLAQVAAVVRRMFDLDADPKILCTAMAADAHLSGIWQRHPGLRVARAWSGFESMISTVLGQLVSVSFGRVLIKELMQAAGSSVKHPKTSEPIFLFPTDKQILNADLASVRTSPVRRNTLRALAEMTADDVLDWRTPQAGAIVKKTLRAVTGVGPWTAEYVAMRGFADNDAFPATDYGLKQELKRHPRTDPRRVSPYRAYAAVALWKSFAEHKVLKSSAAAESGR